MTETNNKKLKLHVSQLKKGMYVAELDKPWVNTTFLYQGFQIETDIQIEELKNECTHVYIEVANQVDTLPGTEFHDLKNKVHYTNACSVEEEFKIAKTNYSEAYSEVKSILECAKQKENLNIENIQKHVASCADSIIRNPNALMWLTRIKHVDEYTAEHCMNVGILAMSFGRYLGLNTAELEILGQCGLLHDIGKMQINQDILNKPGKLTDDEFNHIKQHPSLGHEMITGEAKLQSNIKEAILSHHERIDGTGYPHGIPASNLNIYTRITSIVDVYDALTSNRCYDKARPPNLALKIIYLGKGKHLDEALALKFIEFIGIYPPGSLIELNSGEVGVVLQSPTDRKLKPKIAIILDNNKKPTIHKIIDLQKHTGPNDLAIKTVLSEDAYDTDLSTYNF